MWITTSAALLLGSFSAIAPPPGVQQEAPAAPDTPEQVEGKFLALEDEFDEARQAFFAEVRAKWAAHEEAGGDQESFEYPDPLEGEFFPRFLELADAGHAEANAWCLQNYTFSEHKGEDARADKTQRVLSLLAGSPSDELMTSLCRFLGSEAFGSPYEETKDKEALLGPDATFAFLDVVRSMAEGDDLKAMTLYTRGSAIQDSAEAAIWFGRVATEFPDTALGQRCVGQLFAANNLQIGMVAPDIVGKDHDGNDIRRSDFAGKVTVLDFWGFW